MLEAEKIIIIKRALSDYSVVKKLIPWIPWQGEPLKVDNSCQLCGSPVFFFSDGFKTVCYDCARRIDFFKWIAFLLTLTRSEAIDLLFLLCRIQVRISNDQTDDVSEKSAETTKFSTKCE